MQIGFDAKRAFHNQSGLGNYSRNLIHALLKYYPEHQYYLYNPRMTAVSPFRGASQVHEVNPGGIWKSFPSLWRRWGMCRSITRNVSVFHGLSNELPYGIQQTRIPSLVTIHDLIFEHYPEQYARWDVAIYRKKFREACGAADRIIATSDITRNDLIQLYKVSEARIRVVYQSCEDRFFQPVTDSQRKQVREKYQLTEPFILYVGSLIERKNALGLIKAMRAIPQRIHLVIIGKGNGAYRETISAYLRTESAGLPVTFLEESYAGQDILHDLPAIYQAATCFVYPSVYEGFGIPVLEAMASGTPVITSPGTSMSEIGADAVYYADPRNIEAMAAAIQLILQDEEIRNHYRQMGQQRAQQFSPNQFAQQMMKQYQEINPI